MSLGRFEEGVRHLARALEFKPELREASQNLEAVLARRPALRRLLEPRRSGNPMKNRLQ
jgi:hypothetical protein